MDRHKARLARLLGVTAAVLTYGPAGSVAASDDRISLPRPLRLPWFSSTQTCQLPVDDSVGTDPKDWFPWTHRPHCVDNRYESIAKFCVYTDASHGDNGISLIAKPEAAAASLDEILNFPRNPKVSDPPYEIVQIPDKGFGVVATRLIPRFEVFMWDYAAITADVSLPRSVKKLPGYRLLHHAAEQLVHPQAVLNLAMSNPDRASDVLEDVLRTNSFSSDISGMPHMSVFPLISRINHACKPNSFMRFGLNAFSASVATFRDIQPGEEITISYIPLGHTYEERQSQLTNWGFRCSCELCSASSDEIEASDNRRSSIESMKADVVTALKKGKVYSAINMTHGLLDLLDSEGLVPMFTEQYGTLSRIYHAMNDMDKAKEYGRKAIEVLAANGLLEKDDIDHHLNDMLRGFS